MEPSRTALLAYSLPALILACIYLPLFTYVTPFYVEERGVDVATLGAVWIGIRLFDAVSDPAIGWLSDRTRLRFGRRRVWLAASVPLIVLATWQAFAPPADAGLGHAILWLFLLTLGWTMAQTPYAAWGAELSPSYMGRLRVTAWREALVVVGTLIATIVYVQGGSGGDGLAAVAMLVAVGLPIAVAISVWGAGEPSRRTSASLSIAEGWAAMRANAPFRRLIAAWFVNGAANALPGALFLFYVGGVLQATEEEAGILFLAYFASAVLGIPLWSWLAGRTSKHRAWGIAMLYACSVFLFVFALGPGDVIGFGVICVLTGLALGADLSLPPAIQADVVELDTERTGAERAGLFFAIWQVATKAALAIGSGTALILLGWAGFEAGTDNAQPAIWALTILYAGVPVALKLTAIAFMWRFSLTPERLAAA